MNLFQLEYFVTLAETLNYTKASQKLNITQPTLSRLIINLEHSIGSQLFIRNKREVKLTNAGKLFYSDVVKTLDSYEKAVKNIQDMENGTTGVINLGFLGTALSKPLPKIINTFRDQFPTIQINPYDFGYSQMMKALANNELDVALVPDLELDEIPNFSKKIITTDGICLVVNKAHKFAAYDSIDLREAKDEPFINLNVKASRRDHNLILMICKEHGFNPNTLYEVNTLFNMIVMVESNMGSTILAKHMQDFAPESVRFIPIRNYEAAFKVACLYENSPSQLIKQLLAVIQSCFSEPSVE